MTQEKKPLPTFGPYSMVPTWFLNYCVPIVGPSAACVWLLLWSKCRWMQDVYTVPISTKSISRILNLNPSTTITALNNLMANGLLTANRAQVGRIPKTYTVIVYAPESARLRFKSTPKSCSRKNHEQLSMENPCTKPILVHGKTTSLTS